MDMPIQVPIDNPDADTEWNDILRKHGVIPEKPPSPTPMIEEAILEARKLAHENRLEGKDLDELDELEDEEDDDFLEGYRQKRLAEMSYISTRAHHGSVYPLSKPDYANAVTEASKTYFVLVHLSSTNAESRHLSELFRAAAQKFADVKFCEMRAEMAIEGYPERNCPTILVYKDTDIKKQVVTLKEWNGVKASLEDIEKLLVSVDAIKINDVRLKNNAKKENGNDGSRSIRAGDKINQDDDEDWD